MRKGLATFGVTLLAAAGVAVAASAPTIKVAVTPDTPSSQSTLTVSATGPFKQKSLPTSLKFTAQKGFRSSPKSVKVLCNTSKVSSSSANPCPGKSKIGSGKAVGTVSGFGTQTAPFTLYLGTPQRTGDIAAVILSATVPPADSTENVIGRLFKSKTGSMELLFSHLIAAPVSVTLKKLTLRAGAVNGKYSLITNPSSCTEGHWMGTLDLKFSSGPVSKNTPIPCTK